MLETSVIQLDSDFGEIVAYIAKESQRNRYQFTLAKKVTFESATCTRDFKVAL